MRQGPHPQREAIGSTDRKTISQKNDWFEELHGSVGFEVPIPWGCKIIMIRAIAYVRIHVQPLRIGETVTDCFGHKVTSTSVVTDVHDDTLSIFEFVNYLINSSSALFATAKIPEVKIAYFVCYPAKGKNKVASTTFYPLFELAFQVFLLDKV